MNNKFGGFVPALSNWDLGPLEDPQIDRRASCAARQQTQTATRTECTARPPQTCRGSQRKSANSGVGSVVTRCTGQADCTCEACARKQAAAAASQCIVNVTPTVPVCPAPVESCPAQGATCSVPQMANQNVNSGVGMVYAVSQTLANTFDAHSALAAGTLFPELHKPLNGYCPNDVNCATHQQEASFVLWELRLYLNTHPNDTRALALWRNLVSQMGESYATAFLPDCTANWTWVNGPWPWEVPANCC